MKECIMCKKIKSLNEFYSQEKESKRKGKYIYYCPECKECKKERQTNWNKENRESVLVYNRKYNKTPYGKKRLKEGSKQWRESGKQTEYQKKIKDRLPLYRENHNDHDITDEEWEVCLNFFNWSCAYCEFSWDEHILKEGQQLHKEHVDHNGSIYIENCIPSCRSCNSQKHDKEFNDWFNKENPRFTKKRLNKIVKWVTKVALKSMQ